MYRPRIFRETKLLLRQIVAAWLVLFLSVILFTVFALLLNLVFRNQGVIIIASFVLVFPFLVGAHVYLKNNGYSFRKVLDTKLKKNDFLETAKRSKNSTLTLSESSEKLDDREYFLQRVKEELESEIVDESFILEKSQDALMQVAKRIAILLRTTVEKVLDALQEMRLH